MMEVLIEHATEILLAVVTSMSVAYAKHLNDQKKKFEQIMQEDKNRQYRQMILDEIEPIIEELKSLSNQVSMGLSDLRKESNDAYTHMYDDLNKIVNENNKNLELIINSYKFRLIQLCKTHLRDGWITQDDFDQVSEMYKLYHGLGGNGQAHEYYEKVMELDVVSEPRHDREKK